MGSSGETASFRLSRRPSPGFELLGPGKIEIRPDGEEWQVRGARFGECCRVEPTADSTGYRLIDADDRWLGIASSTGGGQIGADPRSLLLADGALYRFVCGASGYELLSWEVAASYAAWRRQNGEWCFEATAAGDDLPGMETIAVLTALMILDEQSEEADPT